MCIHNFFVIWIQHINSFFTFRWFQLGPQSCLRPYLGVLGGSAIPTPVLHRTPQSVSLWVSHHQWTLGLQAQQLRLKWEGHQGDLHHHSTPHPGQHPAAFWYLLMGKDRPISVIIAIVLEITSPFPPLIFFFSSLLSTFWIPGTCFYVPSTLLLIFLFPFPITPFILFSLSFFFLYLPFLLHLLITFFLLMVIFFHILDFPSHRLLRKTVDDDLYMGTKVAHFW